MLVSGVNVPPLFILISKLRLHSPVKTIQNDMALVGIIQAFWCQFNLKLDPHYALAKSIQWLFLPSKKSNIFNEKYWKVFEALVETKTQGGKVIKAPDFVHTKALRMCVTPRALTASGIHEVKLRVRNSLLAAKMFGGADNAWYDKLKDELIYDCAKWSNTYPKSIHDLISLRNVCQTGIERNWFPVLKIPEHWWSHQPYECIPDWDWNELIPRP